MAVRKGPIIFIAVAVVFLALVVLIRLGSGGGVAEGTVLSIRVAGSIPEEASEQFFESDEVVFRELLGAVERARQDDAIAGISFEVQSGLNFAQTQELRGKLQEFVASGKFCAAYLEVATNLSYYLASACPEIYLTPTSNVYMTGLMGSQTFYRGLFDKLNIYPDMYHIAEYKSARNIYTEKGFTRPHREMVLSLLTGWQAQIVKDIAESRGLEEAAVRRLLRRGPFLATEAVENGLVDELLYHDEYLDRLREKAQTSTLQTIGVAQYAGSSSSVGASRVAIVYATGTIVPGKSQENFLAGRLMGSDTVAEALRQARQDDSIRAIVLRVDSPGGSALASEIIRREVALAQETKPVVVSMANLAASGGYWIAMSAEKIVADPGTLTGSIGVVFGKFNIKGLYNLIGINTEHIALTPNATFFYPYENFTPEQRRTVNKFMGDIYQNFVKGVAAGRGMKIAEVEKIAKGRVWLGAQAYELGLVDELGGLETAVMLAKELSGIPADQAVEQVIFPRPKSAWEKLRAMLSGSTKATLSPEQLLNIQSLPLFREPGLVLMPFTLEVR